MATTRLDLLLWLAPAGLAHAALSVLLLWALCATDTERQRVRRLLARRLPWLATERARVVVAAESAATATLGAEY